MNNRDANLKQILSCDVMDPSVAYATGALVLQRSTRARLMREAAWL